MYVRIKALSVLDNKDGTFLMQFPSKPLATSEVQLLERLFPNTFQRVENLLAVECLLESIIQDGPLEPSETPPVPSPKVKNPVQSNIFKS